MTTQETNIRNEYANEDMQLLEKESFLAITDTKLGTIWAEFENGIYKMKNALGQNLHEGTNRNNAIEFIANSYQVS